MGRSKVIFGDEVLMDLTADTVTKDKLLKGATAHDKTGAQITGECEYDANTQDATATAAEILAGKAAYNKGVKVTGEMPNKGTVNGTIADKDGSFAIPQGYHDGAGKVTLDSTEKAKLISSNIRQGVNILGVEGDMSGTEDVKAQSKEVEPYTNIDQTIMPDDGYNYLSQVIVKKISYTETENSAGGTTVQIGTKGTNDPS